jgi:hypothetical protein
MWILSFTQITNLDLLIFTAVILYGKEISQMDDEILLFQIVNLFRLRCQFFMSAPTSASKLVENSISIIPTGASSYEDSSLQFCKLNIL